MRLRPWWLSGVVCSIKGRSGHFRNSHDHSIPMSAYGTGKAGDTDFRKKWDKQEYAEKAKKRDLEEKERMQENEERMKQGM